MAQKLHNQTRAKSLRLVTDDAGLDYLLKPNGKKHYFLTTAITANTTATPTGAAAGDTAETSHATGLSGLFVSDGSKWQTL